MNRYDPRESAGYRWDLEDRDRLYAGGVEWRGVDGPFAIPNEIDPRPWMRIENQGPMGSCRGHSLSTGMEFIYRAIVGEIIQFSPMWCYLATQKLDGLFGRDSGSTIENGVIVATKQGTCTLKVFPYPDPVRYSTYIPDGASEDAANYKAGRYSPIEDFEAGIQWIGTGQGYIDVGVQYPFAHNNGLVTEWRPTGRGGHAMAIIGYIDDPRYGRLYLLFNSHGTRSARAGVYLVTERAFNQMCRDGRSSVIGVSDMPTVQPREVDFTKTSMIRYPY